MNNLRRKEIDKLIDKLGEVNSMLDDINSQIEDIKCEEEDAYDNLPESIQEGYKGDIMQEAIDNLDYAVDVDYQSAIDELIDYLEQAKG